MVRRLLLFCCLLFGAVSGALAQHGFRVSVFNDVEEPLIGAYIYVNDRAVAVADTLGWAVIPLEKIKLDDSISVSYVATEGQSMVVDQVLLTKGEYQFVLEENHGTLLADEVTVKAKIKRLYRKSLPIKRLSPYVFYNLYNTHFTMNITNPGDSVPSHWIAGRLEGIYTSMGYHEHVLPAQYRTSAIHALNPNPAVFDSLLQEPQSRVGFVNDYPLGVITNDDTTGLSHTLKYFLPRALRAINLALYRIYDPEPDYKELAIYPNLKVNYGYLGKDQDTSTFRLIYSGHGAGTSEVVIKTDVTDKINRELVEATLSFKDTINGNSYFVKVKTRTKMISENSSTNLGGVWQIPTEVEYHVESDGTIVNITMSNINIRSFFEKMKVSGADIYFQNSQKSKMPKNDKACLESCYYEIERYFERMVHETKRAEEKRQRKEEKAKLSRIN